MFREVEQPEEEVQVHPSVASTGSTYPSEDLLHLLIELRKKNFSVPITVWHIVIGSMAKKW